MRRGTGGVDTGRLGEAVARPGMDTRVWISLAIVTDFHVDPAEGVFVDVTLMPSGLPDTARVGACYAGAGFGVFAELKVDDEVLVAAPSGDPAAGLVVLRSLWSAADPPPTEAAPGVVLLRAEKGVKVHVVTDGADVLVEVRGGGKCIIDAPGGVELGGKGLTALDGVVHGSGTDPYTGLNYTALGNASAVVKAKK